MQRIVLAFTERTLIRRRGEPVPACNQNPPDKKTETLTGTGDDCRKAKRKGTDRAVEAALKWALETAAHCDHSCPNRVVTITVKCNECTRSERDETKQVSACEWTATVVCTANPVTPPADKQSKGKGDKNRDGLVLDCTKYYVDNGKGKGENDLEDEAKSEAETHAKAEAASSLEGLVCDTLGNCPNMNRTVEIGTPKAQKKRGEEKFEAWCEWKVLAECAA
jgi:hypothetical protein